MLRALVSRFGMLKNAYRPSGTSRQALHGKVLLINHISIAAVRVHQGDVPVVIQRDQPAVGQPTHIDVTVVVHLLGRGGAANVHGVHAAVRRVLNRNELLSVSGHREREVAVRAEVVGDAMQLAAGE